VPSEGRIPGKVAIVTGAGMRGEPVGTRVNNVDIAGRHSITSIDVAGAALFLASDDSKFISGVVLPVNGGAGQIQPLSALDLVAGVPGWI
jgi:hypothetical protein